MRLTFFNESLTPYMIQSITMAQEKKGAVEEGNEEFHAFRRGVGSFILSEE